MVLGFEGLCIIAKLVSYIGLQALPGYLQLTGGCLSLQWAHLSLLRFETTQVPTGLSRFPISSLGLCPSTCLQEPRKLPDRPKTLSPPPALAFIVLESSVISSWTLEPHHLNCTDAACKCNYVMSLSSELLFLHT